MISYIELKFEQLAKSPCPSLFSPTLAHDRFCSNWHRTNKSLHSVDHFLLYDTPYPIRQGWGGLHNHLIMNYSY